MSIDTTVDAGETGLANPELTGFEVHGMTRSSFILRGALAAGAFYGTAAVTPFVSQALAETGGGDAEILNFALTLEYLEADFYNVKGKSLNLSGEAKTYAKSFGEEESEHVTALTAAIKQLGAKPVAKPTFAFPATSESSFLALASVLENTGVGAYNGAAPSLQSKQVLAAAGSIVQIEARHAAAIDLLLGKSPTPTEGFDTPLTKAQVLAKAGPLIKK
ncbi:MAG TPA: ferritin-like domain-containing protein [Solirubrobacteraceae bacterium]|nr:ferritin-like domain-containing protein [Solirubrobacteraceae bacterium]